MSARNALIEQLKIDEGLRLKMYRCSAGKNTIGYGHNLDAKPISARAALVMLEDDISDTLAECETIQMWRGLDPVRQAVIANMVFNMGLARVLAFRKMWAAIDRRDWAGAAHEMLSSKWAEDVGDGEGGDMDRAERLALLMAKGF